MTPISQRVLSPGDNLVILFPRTVGSGADRYDVADAWVFVVALARNFTLDYRQLPAIAAGNGLDYDYLGDGGHGSGNDVLRIVNDDWHVYHFGLAPADPNLRVYVQIDPSGVQTALDYESTTQASPTAGSDFDYFSSKEMKNVFDPENEFIAFRNKKEGKFYKWGFYAEADVSANSPLYLRGRGYKLLPVLEKDKRLEVIDELRKTPEKQDVKTIAVLVGGIKPYNIGTHLPKAWREKQNYETLTLQEITGVAQV